MLNLGMEWPCDFWTSHAKELTCTKFQLWPFRPEVIKGNIKFKMADFGPNKVFCPNFQIVISQEPLVFGAEIYSFHAMFQWYLGVKMKKFWEEVRVSMPWMIWYVIWNCLEGLTHEIYVWAVNTERKSTHQLWERCSN